MVRRSCLTFVAIACLIPTSASAQPPADAQSPASAPPRTAAPVYRFAIPAGDLAATLTMFSIATSLQVAADGPTLRGRRSRQLTGRYTARAALQQILARQDLDFTFKGGSILIRRRKPTAARLPQRAIKPGPAPAATPPREHPPEDIVVIGRGEPRQIQAIPALDIARTTPGTSPVRLIEKLPGVAFQSANALGTNEYSLSLTIRSFNL